MQASAAWTVARAEAWSRRTGLLVGCNYTPAYAGNPITFWSAATFDAAAIARELDLAQGLGFNALRVYLHDLVYAHEGPALFARFETFLGLAAARGLGVAPVIFDSVWHPFPVYGAQRDPEPGVHNAAWVQSPGVAILRDASRFAALEPYVTALLARFRDDPRILFWDLWNEPDNENYGSYGDRDLGPEKAPMVANYLESVFAWARAAAPTQPLTSAVWRGDWSPQGLTPLQRVQLDASDIITFHNYGPPEEIRAAHQSLVRYRRPIVCTEWMARPRGSTFAACLPVFVELGIGAMSWGLVAGRSQCHYPWNTWRNPATREPELWFHDIYRPDHTPYDAQEIAAIRQATRPSGASSG
jgi:hypothetical protein